MRDGTRSRGIGFVEFETREHLIEGLKRTDKEVYGRKIRVNVSDKTDTDGGRGSFGNNRSNRGTGGEERPEMSETWKRAERK
jgi:RNA recognition motif-containing protein